MLDLCPKTYSNMSSNNQFYNNNSSEDNESNSDESSENEDYITESVARYHLLNTYKIDTEITYIGFTIRIDHDGYDEYGPKSDLYQLYIVYKKGRDFWCDVYYGEDWFNDQDFEYNIDKSWNALQFKINDNPYYSKIYNTILFIVSKNIDINYEFLDWIEDKELDELMIKFKKIKSSLIIQKLWRNYWYKPYLVSIDGKEEYMCNSQLKYYKDLHG